MISQEIIKKVEKSKQHFTELFSSIFFNNQTYTRYFDKNLADMYDHNFSSFIKEVDDKSFNELLDIKRELNEGFMKISLKEPCGLLTAKGFQKEILLTLLKEDYSNFSIPEIDFVTYKRYSEHKEIIEDLIKIEKEYYGTLYTEDFCERRWRRHQEVIDNGHKELEIWGVYHNDKMIGFAYSYFNDDVVAMDSLLTINEYRNKYVASNLIKEIANYYKVPIYLHADEEETPKEIYYKLGFKKIATSYDYLLVDKEHV